MKGKNILLITFSIFILMLTGCSSNDDIIIPSYLHLDKISVTHNSDGTTAMWGDSWLTHEIDAAQIELWFENENSTTTLGTFELPCTIPVITTNRKIKKIQIYPFVKQNGISATHIVYPFYEYYIAKDITIAPDSITNIGILNNNNEWEITVPYKSTKFIDIKMHEFFEPQQMSIALDSNAIRITDEDACSGLGFGRVSFKADEKNKTFFIEDKITEKQASSNLYLEMDYRTDAMLTVSMESSYALGGAPSIVGVMTLYATNNEWHKIYINLGRAWKYFNYNPNFRIGFSILNTEKIEGKVDMDNLKILSI